MSILPKPKAGVSFCFMILDFWRWCRPRIAVMKPTNDSTGGRVGGIVDIHIWGSKSVVACPEVVRVSSATKTTYQQPVHQTKKIETDSIWWQAWVSSVFNPTVVKIHRECIRCFIAQFAWLFGSQSITKQYIKLIGMQEDSRVDGRIVSP